MRKFTRKALTAGAVAATTVALTAVPASAAGTWTISPAGGISGFNTQNVGALDLNTGAAVSCDTSEATGNVPTAGSGLSGDGIAQLTGVTFSNSGGPCPATGGILVTLTTSGFPWQFNAQSYDSSTGVTSGTLTGVTSSLHGSDECDATVGGPGGGAGTISGSYDNNTGLLSVSGNNLEVLTADADCDPNLINVGDQIQLIGQYGVAPDSGDPLVITSP